MADAVDVQPDLVASSSFCIILAEIHAWRNEDAVRLVAHDRNRRHGPLINPQALILYRLSLTPERMPKYNFLFPMIMLDRKHLFCYQ
jgi:hypothetical protein